ncbi:MAG: hypothetical protein RL653_2822 [Pseudomonadota bacterium]
MGLLTTDKFNPTLFVGLGGNGGKIVQLMAARLRRHPNWDRVRSLCHFLAVDTNKDDLDKLKDVPAENRFLVSSFDQRAYVERKRGKAELPEDTLLTQWVPHDYAFRAAQGAGAGQIRMESRLRLYYNLEEDRRGIKRTVLRMLDESIRRENPWRDNENRVVRVMVYGSVAGGTGSGGFLPMAYLLNQWVREAGWGRPSVVGVLTLPTTFLDKVRPQLHADIMANGYAALKELEYLTRQLAYAGGVEEIEFHYDPGTPVRERQFVRERPFALTYLIDRPDQLSIEKYENAVADACYLQIFSPLLGAQAGEYDNYEKHQKKLALGHFSAQYGTFGTALLQLPRRDILKYAAMRFVADTFQRYLSFGANDPDFRVNYGDPAFQRLEQNEKNKKIDEKFKAYVDKRAQDEKANNEKGAFYGVAEQVGDGDVRLPLKFQETLAELFGQVDPLIDLPSVQKQGINPSNPSLAHAIATLQKTRSESISKVNAFLEAQRAQVASGQFIKAFFDKYKVNPVTQRYFLTRLLETRLLLPALLGDESCAYLEGPSNKVDLDGYKNEILRMDQELSRLANPGLLSKLTDRDNAAFTAAKNRNVARVDGWAKDMREELKRDFWQRFEGELRRDCQMRLDSFRRVSQLADERAQQLEAEAERFRKDPASVDPDADVAQYYLDAEVLRDDRRRERLWNDFYTHQLDGEALVDRGELFSLVTEAFKPARNPDGTQRARDANEIISVVREGVEEKAKEVFARALEALKLDLPSALELEQRYVALHEQKQAVAELRRAGKLEDALRAVPAAKVRAGIEDRLRRLADECVLLAHVDATRKDDPTVVPAEVFYAGLHDAYASDEQGSLWNVLKGTVSGVQRVGNWNERDSLVLYRALLGVPVYFFKNVQSELQPAYQKVRADPNRSYPLHIEGVWEKGAGLPDLDPVAIHRAQLQEAENRKAQKAADERATRIRAFTLCALFGAVERGEAGYSWSYSGVRKPLGADRAEAFTKFEALDPMLRGDLEKGAEAQWKAGRADKAARERLSAEVEAYARRLQELYARAISEDRDAERRFLQDERSVVELLQAEARPAA